MRTLARYELTIGAAAVLLTGCAGGIVPPHSSVLSGAASTVQPPSTYKVLHSFGNGSDGKYPYANLVNVNGTLYGTTSLGGSYRQGIVYSVTPTGMEKVWHSFGYGSDGAQPDAGLINVNGVLYGTTDTGTHYNAGTVFSITPSGKEKVLHTFGIGYDGRYPVASLINVSGTLYGTTAGGGQYAGSPGAGTVFSITTSGKEKVLHSFGLGYDGAQPRAGLINVNGTLYGTTEGGGKYGSVTTFYGTVFSITPSGKEKVLHSFGNGSDGRDPQASLLNVKGTLYGTTDGGGQYKAGTVFSITPSGGEKVLHSFGNGSDGKYPYASLINVDGTLYGTTASGGQYAGSPGAGTIFSIRPSGKEKVLHSFGKVTAGVDPQASLTDVSGTLYGTTNLGGGYNTIYSSYGTVFSFTP